jgi:hypothetical protein
MNNPVRFIDPSGLDTLKKGRDGIANASLPSITVTAKRETSSLSNLGYGIAYSQTPLGVTSGLWRYAGKYGNLGSTADNMLLGMDVIGYTGIAANLFVSYADYKNNIKQNPELATYYKNKLITELVITVSGGVIDYVVPGLGLGVAIVGTYADQAGYLDGLYSYSYHITYTPGSGIMVIPLKIKALESTVGTGEVFSRSKKINY